MTLGAQPMTSHTKLKYYDDLQLKKKKNMLQVVAHHQREVTIEDLRA